jgi:DNA-binding GntR family transcriptional regulator
MDNPRGRFGGVSREGAHGQQQTVFGRTLTAQPALSRTVSEQVHGFIQHALLSGQLNPGDRLAEGELAAALGVSRTPIREALRQLDSDGLVVVLPHRGTFVRTLDPLRGRQLYEARLLVEPATARAAAARITGEQLEALRPLLDSALNEAKAGDMGGASIDSEAFHLALFRIAGNDVLLELWTRVWAEWQLFRVCAWRNEPHRPRAVANEHAALYDALAARDEARAGAVMTDHLAHAWSHVERFLATSGAGYGPGPAEFTGQERYSKPASEHGPSGPV